MVYRRPSRKDRDRLKALGLWPPPKGGKGKASGSKGKGPDPGSQPREPSPPNRRGDDQGAAPEVAPRPLPGREASTSGESSSTSVDPPGPAAAVPNQGPKVSPRAPVPALPQGLSFPNKAVQERGAAVRAFEVPPEDADTSPAYPSRQGDRAKGVAMTSSPRTASASHSSNTGMGDPPAETGGTTHPAQEVEKSGVKEEPKTPTQATGGQRTGVVLEPQASSQPAEIPASASEAAPPAKVRPGGGRAFPG